MFLWCRLTGRFLQPIEFDRNIHRLNVVLVDVRLGLLIDRVNKPLLSQEKSMLGPILLEADGDHKIREEREPRVRRSVRAIQVLHETSQCTVVRSVGKTSRQAHIMHIEWLRIRKTLSAVRMCQPSCAASDSIILNVGILGVGLGASMAELGSSRLPRQTQRHPRQSVIWVA